MSADSATLRDVLSARLRAARQAAGLSQKTLGENIGLDAFTASARINRYERGVHEPDLQTLARMAAALDLPACYLLTEDERLARMILGFTRLSRKQQDKLLESFTG